MIPEDLRYTDAHEWVRATSDGTVRVGVTDYAQRQLGDVVFVQLPEIGQRVVVGVAIGEVESTKSVSELFSPVTGEVVGANDTLAGQPELVNAEPYGDGWMLEIRPDEPAPGSLEGLLDASAYRSLTNQS